VIKHKKQQIEPSSDESGFTLIESLVAIVVVAILMTAISPVIVLSTATRIQAKRIEQASIAARNFIDGVKTQTIDPTKIPSVEGGDLAAATDSKKRNIPGGNNVSDYLISTTKMPVPTSSDKSKLFCVEKDGKIKNPDCSTGAGNSFFIQARTIKVTDSTANDGYRLAIRVYRKEAFDTPGVLEASDASSTDKSKNKITQQTFTGGLGSIKRPLVEMTSDIASDTTTFRSLCSRLGRADNKNCDS
jgi:prepilin-type N-terminal cleavage/methylation domain-containing protein